MALRDDNSNSSDTRKSLLRDTLRCAARSLGLGANASDVGLAEGETLLVLSRKLDFLQEEISKLHGAIMSQALRETGRDSVAETLRDELRMNRIAQNRAFTHDNMPHPSVLQSLMIQYRLHKEPLSFDDVSMSVFSQNGEDGILMYILASIGIKTRRCVEVGCDLSNSTIGVPECNSANLIVNFAFDGLIIDKSEENMGAVRHFFARSLTTQHFHKPDEENSPADAFSPTIRTTVVDPDNVNDVLAACGAAGEVDVFCQDFDGPDVTLWRNLDVIDPRVVVIEINNRLPFTDIVYGTWSTSNAPTSSLDYQASMGSSLAAACEVAAQKGYVFVGMNPTLLNAFFVKRSEWNAHMLPERRPQDYVDHRFSVLHRMNRDRSKS